MFFLNSIKHIYNKLEKSRYKIFILSLSFFSILLLRCFLELFFSRFYYDGFILKEFPVFLIIFSQWIIWYFAVFLIIFSIYRYFLKIDIKKIVYFVFGAFVLMIPVFVGAFIFGKNLNINYLSIRDFGAFLSNFFTLLYFDKNNNFIFYEFLVLFIGMPIASYLFSKNIIKSLVSPFIAYFLMVFVLATRYICSSSECLLIVESNLKDSIGVFYIIPFFVILFLIFIFPEFKKYIKSKNNIFNSNYFLFFLITYFVFVIFNFAIKNIIFVDFIYLSLFYIVFYYFTLFILKHNKEDQYKDFIYFLIFPEFLFFITFFIYVLFI